MLLPTVPSLLAFMLLQGAPVEQPPTTAACEDLQRIELALAPTTADRASCVSPGLMTNFVFDAGVDVELEDEARFVEVTRGRSTLSFLPPADMAPGERLRLTARIGEEASQQRVTILLVAHPGRATHQVEVYRDQRPRESYQHEVAQERARNQRLQEELERVRARLDKLRRQLEQPIGLGELLSIQEFGDYGVQVQLLSSQLVWRADDPLAYLRSVSYRSAKSVAVMVWLKNFISESWRGAEASLVNDQGKELKGRLLRQESSREPTRVDPIIVEVAAGLDEARGEWTLVLRGDGARSITIFGVTFP